MKARRSQRRIILLISVLVAVVVVGVAWRNAAPSEPEYQGRPLSSWLQQMLLSELNKDQMDHAQAAEAVRQMGPSVLPELMALLRVDDSGLRRTVTRWAARKKLFGVRFASADVSRECAVAGYGALGAAAKPHIPELCRVLTNHTAPYARRSAARALGFIGLDSDGAVGALLEGTKDENEWVRNYSVWALSRIPADPGRVVPALIDSLEDRFPPAREIAALALGNYGPGARAAVPALLGARATNKAAALALAKIEPERALQPRPPGTK